MATFHYEPQEKICPSFIEVDYHKDNGGALRIDEVYFAGGCEILHLTISSLLCGMTFGDALNVMDKNMKCGKKNTSCTMELCEALRKIVANELTK